MKNNKKEAGFFLLILVSIGVAVFFLAPNYVGAQKFKVLLPSASEHILYSYIWIAKEKGFFDEEGLDVEISVNDYASIPAQVSFDPDFPIGVIDAESLFEKDHYAPNIIPFMFFMYGASGASNYDTHLVVSKESGIKTTTDLKDKTIRVGKPPTIIALKKILKETNLDIAAIQIDRTRAHLVLDSVRSREIDAAITYFPTMPVMLASLEVEILKEDIFSNYINHHVPDSFIGVNKKFAEENPEAVKGFLRAMEKAFVYGNNNPKELITSFSKLKTFSDSSWILDEELIQKGAALIPEIPIRNLDEQIYMQELGKSETVYEHLIEYQNILYNEGFYDEKVDLQVLYDNYIAFISS